MVCPYSSIDFATAMTTAGLDAMDSLLLRWIEQADWGGPDPIVAAVTQKILKAHGTVSVSELAAGCGVGYRQVLRRFHEATGLTPKEFARLRRLREACVRALGRNEPGWADLSAATGFADQSHLVREFQDIYGWPPRLVHEYLRRIDHVNLVN
jgi:transcriptional regulator GlxA family with amidase domain